MCLRDSSLPVGAILADLRRLPADIELMSGAMDPGAKLLIAGSAASSCLANQAPWRLACGLSESGYMLGIQHVFKSIVVVSW